MNWGPEMKPTRSLSSIKLNGSARRKASAACRVAVAILAFVTLAACEQNSFVPPPPPKVDVGVPIQRSITRYLEATGNTAPIRSVDLVARVQGFLQAINYQDGSFVKEGTTLFTIEPETYKLKLEQAQAAEVGAHATVKQTESDFKRQTDLVAKQAVSQSTLEASTATRDNAQASLQQAQVNTRKGRSTTVIPMSPRHSTASSAPIWSRLENSSARRRRPSSLPSFSLIRST